MDSHPRTDLVLERLTGLEGELDRALSGFHELYVLTLQLARIVQEMDKRLARVERACNLEHLVAAEKMAEAESVLLGLDQLLGPAPDCGPDAPAQDATNEPGDDAAR